MTAVESPDEALQALAAKAARAAKKVAGRTDAPPPEAPKPECPFEITATMEDSFASSVLSLSGLELGEHTVVWLMRTKAQQQVTIPADFDGTEQSFTVRAIFASGVCRVNGVDWPVEIVDHPEFRGDVPVGPAVLYVPDANR